ncbi:MAG TPA: hypothetical protein VL282_13905 [Tepidisphaeraceae bacterium]|jgi:hypothetical protein|nr:hypothetical protein [Tepidisphaeraceae bacterium]
MGIREFGLFASLSIVLAISGACQAQGESSAKQAMESDDYPILSWEARKRADMFSDAGHGIETLKDCGYTRVGFLKPEQLPLAEKLGMKAFVRDMEEPLAWEKLTDEQIDSTVKATIDKSKHSAAVIGYFITDEPGVQRFAALGKAVAAVRKYAPGKIAYINLYPDYATLGAPNLSQLGTANYTDYLERFVKEVKPDFISYDNYRIISSNDLQDAKPAESYWKNLLEVRRVAQEHNLPFWNIVCSNQIRPHTVPPSPANLQLQAFTTLASGADCLTWFTYYGGTAYRYAPVDFDGNRTTTWSYLKMVNEQVQVLGREMRKLKSTGVYFTSPAPAQGLPALPGKLVQAVKCETPLMIGEFSGPGGEKYAMIVNLSLQKSGKVFLTKNEAEGYVSPVDHSLIKFDKDGGFWLTPGQGALVKLK